MTEQPNNRRIRSRMTFRLWLYILRAHTGPFLLAFFVIMFVFLLQFLMRFIDKLVGKGIDAFTIIELIGLNLAWMVVLALPMGVLVATLMGFGSLSASNELTAMRSSGVSFLRMLAPVVICAVILGFLDLEFNNNILPDANHSARVLASDIQRKKPTFSILPGEFSNESLLPGYSLFAAKRNDQTGELGDVVIYDHTNGLELNTITAKQAMLKFTSNYQSLVVTLRSGEIHQSYRNDRSQYRKGTFDFYEIVIPTSGFELTREEESSRGDRELSADDLMAYINNRSESAERMRANLKNSLESFVNILTTYIPIYTDSGAPPRASQIADQLRQPLFMISDNASQTRGVENDKASYLVEYHKKYALPVACIVFLLVGAPLGALARRGGIGMGVGLSLGFFILYWSALIGGEKLADRGIMAPWVGMWAANILLTALGLILVIRVLREAPLWKKR